MDEWCSEVTVKEEDIDNQGAHFSIQSIADVDPYQDASLVTNIHTSIPNTPAASHKRFTPSADTPSLHRKSRNNAAPQAGSSQSQSTITFTANGLIKPSVFNALITVGSEIVYAIRYRFPEGNKL